MSIDREKILTSVWDNTSKYYQFASFYERFVSNFYSFKLCESETYALLKIGDNPGTTATDISNDLKITLAAISKMIRKMRDRGWVEQVRNESNNRIYNLYLTETGKAAYNEIKDTYKEYYNLV